MAITPASPLAGTDSLGGHTCHYQYRPYDNTMLVNFMGQTAALSCGTDSPTLTRRRWMVQVYTNPQQGASNGLSGQATQALPSNSLNSLVGNGGQYSALQQAVSASIQQQAAQLAQNVYANNALLQRLQASQLGGSSEVRSEPLKTGSIKLGEIIAYRGWRVTPQGFLRSMSADVIWGPGEPMEGKTESKREHNGVYAFKKLSTFLKEFGNGGLDVYGKVSLWGDIIEHELGYRAQFAKIISLDGYCHVQRPHGIPLKRLQSRYQIAEAA